MLWQGKSVRKSSGGRYHPARSKRRHEIGSAPTDTHIGADKRKISRVRGGNMKVRALRCEIASVCNRKTGETMRATIENVEENASNPNFVRRNLLTKGAIIKTSVGRAKIISRPGQHGVINAILLEE